MNLQEKQMTETTTCFNCQDENNNNFQYQCENNFDEKDIEPMIVLSDTSSDDEYWCSSVNDSELISLDTRKLWHDISHLIKCVYRETNREFSENHSKHDISKTKKYVQILTQLNAECLFKKVETIALEYVDEIRNQVLKRIQTCLKTSNDVQLFISYLLDEYQTFIQAAKNVSIIVSYLEEHYLKRFHLTWLLYNKHLYEKLVYMNKKIQHSMSIMVDLLQPANDNNSDYSPAEYAQLLNRFLAFDEEMSEISCFYKDCETKMNFQTRNSLITNQNQMGFIVKTKKINVCKKSKRIKNPQEFNQENSNSSTTNAVDIPLINNCSIKPSPCQEGSNGSSICSGNGGKESSSISSFDEYLDHNTSSLNFPKDQSEHFIENNNKQLNQILNTVSSISQIQNETNHLNLNENTITNENENNQTITTNVGSKKKSKKNRRKENSDCLSSSNKSQLKTDLILPPKPPLSTTSKLQADLRPLSISLLPKAEISGCSSSLDAKFQTVSFTAGTFASISTDESISSNRLNLNLSHKPGSFIRPDSTNVYEHIDQILCQAAVSNDMSSLLNSLESSNTFDDLTKTCSNNKNCETCSCDSFSESNSSISNGCINCATLTCNFNPRGVEVKERLKIKLANRSAQNSSEQTKSSNNIKPSDNNIDDLVRFIDGNPSKSNELPTKKSKKKKTKQIKTNSSNDEIKQNETSTKICSNDENCQTLTKKQKQKKNKLKQEENNNNEALKETSSTNETKTNEIEKKIHRTETKIEPQIENVVTPDEEINWITISRKQTKHKQTSTTIPTVVSAPSKTNNKQKRQLTAHNSTNSQPKVKPNSKNSTNVTTKSIPIVVNSNKEQSVQQVKVERTSPWTTQQNTQNTLASTSILQATTPAFIPASQKMENILPLDDASSSSIDWNRNDFLLSPGPFQRPNPSFSLAPGSLHSTTSRCIQRPSSETLSTSFPIFSPMNYSIDDSNSTWNNNLSKINSNQTQWKYSNDEQIQSTTISNDFPLYDPFKSGTGLPISTSTLNNNGFEKNFNNSLQTNDIDEMDALDKEIEDFKKYYIDSPEQS